MHYLRSGINELIPGTVYKGDGPLVWRVTSPKVHWPEGPLDRKSTGPEGPGHYSPNVHQVRRSTWSEILNLIRLFCATLHIFQLFLHSLGQSYPVISHLTGSTYYIACH